MLAELGVPISESGLHYRLNAQTVEFMRQLFNFALVHCYEQREIDLKLLQRFARVWLVDSSQITLPPALAEHFLGTRGQA
jgi:hypothetical protein